MTGATVEVDRTLAESFPASDPPSWTFGFAGVRSASNRVERSDIVVLSSDEATTWRGRAGRHVRSWLMASGLVLLLPVALIALPFALAGRLLWSLRGDGQG